MTVFMGLGYGSRMGVGYGSLMGLGYDCLHWRTGAWQSSLEDRGMTVFIGGPGHDSLHWRTGATQPSVKDWGHRVFAFVELSECNGYQGY